MPAVADSVATRRSDTRVAGLPVCAHCGEPCAHDTFTRQGASFCCLGCQTVYSLLAENGLGRFYELNATPGIRIRAAGNAGKWVFLDDSIVRDKMLDFADEQQAKVTWHLPAIHCVACVWLLENLFKLHPGIGNSRVNFSRQEAAITFDPRKIKLSGLAALLDSIGYEPGLTFGESGPRQPLAWRKKAWLQIGLAAFAFGNIMLMSLPFYLGLDSWNGPWFRIIAGWIGILLALPVVTYSAADFWRAAWVSLRQRVLTLEVPIAIGLAAIYGASILEVARHHGPGYCDSLCGLIFFLLCGRLFQKMTYDRLTFDRDYKGFFPLNVIRKTPVGEENIPISRLRTGDHLLLRNGELLPADAILVAGDACLDYSFVTGESEPVARSAGSKLFAGGRQVGGLIEVETLKPVAESYLASLWDNEVFRKNRDSDLNSLTNRYSQRFTRLIVGVALAAAVFWLFTDATKALRVFTSVLIVACPCALALAAPLTHGTALRILARLRIHLRNAMVVEHLAEVDTVVFDKTGTLTSNGACETRFTGSVPLTSHECDWVGSVARGSTHPHSVSLVKSLTFVTQPVAGFHEAPGYGLEGRVDGHKILLGSRTWLEIHGVFFADRIVVPSAVAVAIDGIYRGIFTSEKALRPGMERLVHQLRGRYQLVLLSGDNDCECARFEKLFGPDAVLKFHQAPVEKLEFVRKLQQQGRKVLMVGDGLNDAGALRQADVGVAVVERLGTFSPASDVIIDSAELPALAAVLDFCRVAARIVRAGFVISACYNVAGVSVAAAGFLAPVVCAILMPLSSATIVAFACGVTAWFGARRLVRPAAEAAGSAASGLAPSLIAPEVPV